MPKVTRGEDSKSQSPNPAVLNPHSSLLHCKWLCPPPSTRKWIKGKEGRKEGGGKESRLVTRLGSGQTLLSPSPTSPDSISRASFLPSPFSKAPKAATVIFQSQPEAAGEKLKSAMEDSRMAPENRKHRIPIRPSNSTSRYILQRPESRDLKGH